MPIEDAIINRVNSGFSGPNVTRIVHNVEKFILFNLLNQNCKLQSVSQWQRDKVDWSKKCRFFTLAGCHGNFP